MAWPNMPNRKGRPNKPPTANSPTTQELTVQPVWHGLQMAMRTSLCLRNTRTRIRRGTIPPTIPM
jgi:hypothetical protein